MRTHDKRSAQRALQFALETPWAITEGALQTILEIAAREHDVEAGLEAIAAKLGQPLRETETASVRDGIATIPVAGPLFRYANLFTAISGATSYEVLATDFTQAMEDPSVRGIVLAIDSPGGEVNGADELGELIYQARGRKPVVAMVGGMGASAAYWLASATDSVITSPTAVLGGIGVRSTYLDTRKRDEARGISAIEIVSSQSPRKTLDPTVEEGRAEVQRTVDAIAQVFIETVARNRGVTAARVLAGFGQGGVFVGRAAVEAGLADRVGTYEAAHAELAGGRFIGGLAASQKTPQRLEAEQVQDAVKQLSAFSSLRAGELTAPEPSAPEKAEGTSSLVEQLVGLSSLKRSGG